MKRSIFDIKTEEEYVKYKNKVDINEVDNAGQSALFYFDYGINFDKSEWLIKHGIDIHMLNKYNQNSLFYSNYDKARLLISNGININQIDSSGESPLFRAVASSDEKISQLLIENQADINIVNRCGENALFYSSFKASSILIANGININQLDNRGNNALVNIDDNQLDHVDKAKLLIEMGIDLEIVKREPLKMKMIGSDKVRSLVMVRLAINEKKIIDREIKDETSVGSDTGKRKRL